MSWPLLILMAAGSYGLKALGVTTLTGSAEGSRKTEFHSTGSAAMTAAKDSHIVKVRGQSSDRMRASVPPST